MIERDNVPINSSAGRDAYLAGKESLVEQPDVPQKSSGITDQPSVQVRKKKKFFS